LPSGTNWTRNKPKENNGEKNVFISGRIKNEHKEPYSGLI
jgi:hypothetical protein